MTTRHPCCSEWPCRPPSPASPRRADVGTTTRQFNVPANGIPTETFSGAPTFTTYSVEPSCKDASGQQKAERGHIWTSGRW